MSNYDFLNLSPIEFEELSRDLLQKSLGIRLESFKEGKDHGIDLRYSEDKSNSIIVQCKRYKDINQLKSNLKKEEIEKVKKLSPNRYILVTSASLSPKNKSDIENLFDGEIKSYSDILGKEDLNNLLGQKLNSEIEKKHFKLWITSTNILNSIFSNSILNRTQFSVEEIIKDVKLFVENDSLNQAIKILNKLNYVIISGNPGIGKTTLAKMMIYKYLSQEYQIIEITSDIEEAEKMFEKGTNQVFYYDDFLGSNFLEVGLTKNEEKRLLKFIQKIKNSPNKKLIMTTREYILNQAKIKFEEIENSFDIEIGKCIIDLAKYTRIVRARILYNHIVFSGLSNIYIKELIKNRNFILIIDHKNYNPRIIEAMTSKPKEFNIKREDYMNEFIENLNNPVRIWRSAFEDQISSMSRYMLYILVFSGGILNKDQLEKAFDNFIKIESEKYHLTRYRNDFRKCLKELENTFIRITLREKEYTIAFQNPSIQDYLINVLKSEKDLIKTLIESATFYDQLFNLFITTPIRYVSNDKMTTKKILLDKELIDCIENKIISGYAELSPLHYKTAYKEMTEIVILEEICKFFDLVQNGKINEFIYDKIKNIDLSESEYYERESYVNIILKLNKNFNIDEKVKIIKNVALNLVFVEEINTMFIDLKNFLKDGYVRFILNHEFNFKNVIYGAITNERYNKDDSQGLKDLIDEIVLLEKQFNFDFSDEILNISEEMKKGRVKMKKKNVEDIKILSSEKIRSNEDDLYIDTLFSTLSI